MLFPARRLAARLRGFDPVRVDELVGVVLLVAIQLQVWLSPYVHASACRRRSVAWRCRPRWPFAAAGRSGRSAGSVAVAAQDVFGGRVTVHALGAIPRESWFSTVLAPSFQLGARSALGIGLAVLRIDVLITRDVLGIFFMGS